MATNLPLAIASWVITNASFVVFALTVLAVRESRPTSWLSRLSPAYPILVAAISGLAATTIVAGWSHYRVAVLLANLLLLTSGLLLSAEFFRSRVAKVLALILAATFPFVLEGWGLASRDLSRVTGLFLDAGIYSVRISFPARVWCDEHMFFCVAGSAAKAWWAIVLLLWLPSILRVALSLLERPAAPGLMVVGSLARLSGTIGVLVFVWSMNALTFVPALMAVVVSFGGIHAFATTPSSRVMGGMRRPEEEQPIDGGYQQETGYAAPGGGAGDAGASAPDAPEAYLSGAILSAYGVLIFEQLFGRLQVGPAFGGPVLQPGTLLYALPTATSVFGAAAGIIFGVRAYKVSRKRGMVGQTFGIMAGLCGGLSILLIGVFAAAVSPLAGLEDLPGPRRR